MTNANNSPKIFIYEIEKNRFVGSLEEFSEKNSLSEECVRKMKIMLSKKRSARVQIKGMPYFIKRG